MEQPVQTFLFPARPEPRFQFGREQGWARIAAQAGLKHSSLFIYKQRGTDRVDAWLEFYQCSWNFIKLARGEERRSKKRTVAFFVCFFTVATG